MKQEWQKSHAGTSAKTWFGLEKQKENQPNYQRLLLLTVLPLNYFMVCTQREKHKKFQKFSHFAVLAKQEGGKSDFNTANFMILSYSPDTLSTLPPDRPGPSAGQRVRQSLAAGRRHRCCSSRREGRPYLSSGRMQNGCEPTGAIPLLLPR